MTTSKKKIQTAKSTSTVIVTTVTNSKRLATVIRELLNPPMNMGVKSRNRMIRVRNMRMVPTRMMKPGHARRSDALGIMALLIAKSK